MFFSSETMDDRPLCEHRVHPMSILSIRLNLVLLVDVDMVSFCLIMKHMKTKGMVTRTGNRGILDCFDLNLVQIFAKGWSYVRLIEKPYLFTPLWRRPAFFLLALIDIHPLQGHCGTFKDFISSMRKFRESSILEYFIWQV